MLFRSGNHCFSGGVAFNSLIVEIAKKKSYNIFVPDNPGDPGSAIGAAALLYGKKICSMKTVATTSR